MISIGIALLLLLIVVVTLKRNKGDGDEDQRVPQGWKGWPLIGETFSFLKPQPCVSIGDFMEHRMSRFGKIFTASILGKRVVISADAELNRFVFKNDKKLFEPGWPRSFAELMGATSISMLVGDEHKNMRSIVVDFLNGERLRTAFLREAEEIISSLMSSWKDGGIISAKNEAGKFSFYIMAKEMLSVEPGEPAMEKLMREYSDFIKGTSAIPFKVPGTNYWRAFKSRKNILEILKGEVEERMKEDDRNQTVEKDDLLGWLMRKTSYDLESIGNILLHTLFAGHDTTSRTIALMFYFLQDCPTAVQQLREEHFQVAKLKEQRGEKKIKWEDLKAMEFTKCVVNETLRMGNVARFISKKANTEIEWKGYVIPKNWTIILHLTAGHLDPALFENPTHFDPWRWFGSAGMNKNNNNFMPFGGGPRLCPGAEVARMEMMVFLHHLILNYDWELVEPDPPISFPFLDFSKGLHVKLHALHK